jgi:hypothetical protein
MFGSIFSGVIIIIIIYLPTLNIHIVSLKKSIVIDVRHVSDFDNKTADG